MYVSTRSYLTAGVAFFGAGAIALTPVQPVDTSLDFGQQKALSTLTVNLAAAVTPVDPIQNILDVITATGDNLQDLIAAVGTGLYVNGTFPFPSNTFLNGNLGWRTGGYATGVPLPIIQQMTSNLLIYIDELPDIGGILGQVVGNIGNALNAPFEAGVAESGRVANLLQSTYYNQNINAIPYVDVPILGTLSQRDVGALLPTLAGEETFAALKPILDIASTPISGVLVGAIGPFVAPVLALVNSISNTFALLQESDFGGALTELVNIPVNLVNAVLNGGQTLDLTPVLGLLGVTLPDTITSLGLKMGGLLSPGGVAVDALAAEAVIPDLADIVVPGLPVGPIGALLGLSNYVAKSIVVTPPAEAQVVTPPAAASARIAAAEAPAPVTVDAAVAVSAPAPGDAAPASVQEASPLQVETAASIATPEAVEPDSTPAAAPRKVRASRGGDAASSGSTPKRSTRGAASRG